MFILRLPFRDLFFSRHFLNWMAPCSALNCVQAMKYRLIGWYIFPDIFFFWGAGISYGLNFSYLPISLKYLRHRQIFPIFTKIVRCIPIYLLISPIFRKVSPTSRNLSSHWFSWSGCIDSTYLSFDILVINFIWFSE